MSKPNPMGATFAERAAAAKGEKSYEAPEPAYSAPEGNTTFGQRAGRKSATKAVDGESETVEDKAVSKRAASKKAAKKS